MVVKRIPCDFSQSMYVSQGTYQSNDIVGRKRQIGTKFFFSQSDILPGARRKVGNGYERQLGWEIRPHHVSPNTACYPADIQIRFRPLIGQLWPHLASHWSIPLTSCPTRKRVSLRRSTDSGWNIVEVHLLVCIKQETHPEQVWGCLWHWKSRN